MMLSPSRCGSSPSSSRWVCLALYLNNRHAYTTVEISYKVKKPSPPPSTREFSWISCRFYYRKHHLPLPFQLRRLQDRKDRHHCSTRLCSATLNSRKIGTFEPERAHEAPTQRAAWSEEAWGLTNAPQPQRGGWARSSPVHDHKTMLALSPCMQVKAL